MSLLTAAWALTLTAVTRTAIPQAQRASCERCTVATTPMAPRHIAVPAAAPGAAEAPRVMPEAQIGYTATQPTTPPPSLPNPLWPRSFPRAACAPHRGWPARLGLFAAGAAGAFVAHELGHVAANLFAGNVPRLVGLRGTAGVPFFAISPDVLCKNGRCVGAAGQLLRGGPRTPYLIAIAGFNVQHLGNEVILSQTPALRARPDAFSRGWLAFNLALSVGYAAVSLAHVEDPHGDAGGLAFHARVPRGVAAAALLVPAALDAWRFVRPQDRWAPWASRAGKLGVFGLAWRC